MAPTGQGGQWQEVLCCSVCNKHFNETFLPVSLICGHVICRKCVEKSESQSKPCPHDDWKVTISPSEYPNNVALLSVIFPRKQCMMFSGAKTDDEKKVDLLSIQIARFFREADSERGGTVSSRDISRTLQRKVLALLCYQWRENDGRLKTLKMCRGISERVMVEIILSIQSSTHVSSQLWSAVRARGCQFLGPAMQDDVLRLILMTLETGECIARKNLVMYVVQTLASDYPQVSKTCVGHVVQLLYRASCFNVLKRDGESSLMQLKDEFRTYDALRREHDSQIVQIAFESGLRIGPDQWSALLYADQSHRSHMQSIIDKLQSRNTYQQGIEELRALSTSQTSMLVPGYRYFLSQVIPCLEFFASTDYVDTSMNAVAESLLQIKTVLKLHCSQEDLRKMPKEERRAVLSQPPTLSNRPVLYPLYSQPDENGRSARRSALQQQAVEENSIEQSMLQIPLNSKPTLPQNQSQSLYAPRQKRYQMGIPPNRMGYTPQQHHFVSAPPIQSHYFNPQAIPPSSLQRVRGRRINGALPQGGTRPGPVPMLFGFPPEVMATPGVPPNNAIPLMQTTEVVTADGQPVVNGAPQRVVIMQSPTHLPGGPVARILKVMMEEEPPPLSEDREIKFDKKKPFRIESFLQQRELVNGKTVVKTFEPDFRNRQFCQKDVREHTGCINALQFSHNERLLATGGDDMRGRVWIVDELMIRKTPRPRGIMTEPHRSNIFSLEFDLDDLFLYSGERWGTVIKHDIETNQCIYVAYENHHRGDVYYIDQHPTNNEVVAVTRAKLISFIDNRDRPNPVPLNLSADMGRDFYTAEFHPETPTLILVNSENGGPNVFDCRMTKKPFYERSIFIGLPTEETDWIGSMWSPSGNQFMSLRRPSCPLYFDLISKRCLALHSAPSPIGYHNIKTIKSMTFIDDYTVATGSDHWGIHIWNAPRANDSCGFIQTDREEEDGTTSIELFIEKETKILRGHRSVPNQVRFSRHNKLLVSSGVENSFKLWSDYRLPWSYDIPFERKKRGTYDLSPEEEFLREVEERRILEDALERDGEMDGRARWDDVFSGNAQTAENREILELFDVTANDGDESSSSSDSDYDAHRDEIARRLLRTRGIRPVIAFVNVEGHEIVRFLEAEEEEGGEFDLMEHVMQMRRRRRVAGQARMEIGAQEEIGQEFDENDNQSESGDSDVEPDVDVNDGIDISSNDSDSDSEQYDEGDEENVEDPQSDNDD